MNFIALFFGRVLEAAYHLSNAGVTCSTFQNRKHHWVLLEWDLSATSLIFVGEFCETVKSSSAADWVILWSKASLFNHCSSWGAETVSHDTRVYQSFNVQYSTLQQCPESLCSLKLFWSNTCILCHGCHGCNCYWNTHSMHVLYHKYHLCQDLTLKITLKISI